VSVHVGQLDAKEYQLSTPSSCICSVLCIVVVRANVAMVLFCLGIKVFIIIDLADRSSLVVT